MHEDLACLSEFTKEAFGPRAPHPMWPRMDSMATTGASDPLADPAPPLESSIAADEGDLLNQFDTVVAGVARGDVQAEERSAHEQAVNQEFLSGFAAACEQFAR